MKITRTRKPTMKTFLSIAFLSVLGSLPLNFALGQPANAPVLANPGEPLSPGDLPTQAAVEPAGGAAGRYGYATGRSVANAGSAENRAFGYHAGSAHPAVIIQFSQSDPQKLDTLQEDLN